MQHGLIEGFLDCFNSCHNIKITTSYATIYKLAYDTYLYLYSPHDIYFPNEKLTVFQMFSMIKLARRASERITWPFDL